METDTPMQPDDTGFLSRKTANVLLLIAGIAIAIVFIASSLFYLYLLFIKQATLPEGIQYALLGVVTSTLTGVTVLINGYVNRQHSDKNKLETLESIKNGTGTILAHKIADVLPVPDAVPGGRRKTDPPVQNGGTNDHTGSS